MKLHMLRADSVNHYGKVITLDHHHGSKPTSRMTSVTYWTAQHKQISDLKDFSETARDLERSANGVVILGELTAFGEERAKRGFQIHRRHNSSPDQQATIQDRAQHLLFLDIEFNDSLEDLSDKERIERHIQRLPSSFHHASYVYQFSSSYRVKEGLRVHLFFWVDKAITCDQFRRYLKRDEFKLNGKELVDFRPILPSTALIMSAPIFKGMRDRVEERSGLVTKERSKVVLPHVAYRDEELPKYQRSYVSTGMITNDRFAQDELDKVCNRASYLSDGRNEQVYSDAKYLGQYVGADRLSESHVRGRLLDAYHANGLIKKRSFKDVDRSINRGIQEGKRNPRTLDRHEPINRRKRAIKRPQLSPDPIKLPSSPQEINTETRSLALRAVSNATPNTLSVAKAITGAGKTGALIEASIDLLNIDTPVVYLARNHDLITESENGILDRFRALGVEPKHWQGRSRQCELIKGLKREPTENNKVILAEYEDLLNETPIPRFCVEVGCSLRNTDQCSAWKEQDRTIEGRISVAPQAYLNYLNTQEERGLLPEDTVILIDELHELINTAQYKLGLIRGLALRDQDLKYLDALESGDERLAINNSAEYRARHQPVSLFAKALGLRLNQIRSAMKANQYGAQERLSGSYLLSTAPELKELAEAALNYIECAKPKVKVPTLKDIKKDKHLKLIRGERVKRSGVRILTDIAQLITGQLSHLSTLHMTMSNGVTHIERRSHQELPKSVKIVLADATPRENALKLYAQSLDLELKITESELTPHPVRGLHVKTKSIQVGELFNMMRREAELTPRGIRALNSLAHPFEIMLRDEEDHTEIGIITSLKLHQQIDLALNGKGPLAQSPLIQTLKRFKLVTGYVGRDNQGSNKFERCKTLIMLGEYRPHLGAEHANIDCLAQSIMRDKDYNATETFKTLYREKIDATAAQSFGRIRSVRQAGRTVIAVCPEQPDFKGVTWQTYEARGRAINEKIIKLELKAHQALDQGELLSTKLLVKWGVKQQAVKAFIDRISTTRSLAFEKRSQGVGRPMTFWFDPRHLSRKNTNKNKDIDILRVIADCPPKGTEKISIKERLSVMKTYLSQLLNIPNSNYTYNYYTPDLYELFDPDLEARGSPKIDQSGPSPIKTEQKVPT